MYSKKYPTFKRKCNGTEKQNYIHHKNLQTRTQLHPSAKENRLGKLLTFTSLILRTKEKKLKIQPPIKLAEETTSYSMCTLTIKRAPKLLLNDMALFNFKSLKVSTTIRR